MSGELVIVSTPIGNLGDITARAVEILAGADRILCEDTRRTRILLSALGIPGRGRLVSLHEHNEEGRISSVVAEIAGGAQVAQVLTVLAQNLPLLADEQARANDQLLADAVGCAQDAGRKYIAAASHVMPTTKPGPC